MVALAHSASRPALATAAVAAWMLLVSPALASHGDDLFIFDDCVYQCQQLLCHANPNFKNDVRNDIWWLPTYLDHWHFDPVPLPWYLTALGWTCDLNCDYQCQRVLTRDRSDISGDEVLQFHGKWPFWRVFGVQELASALLSVGNFVPHWYGARKVYGLLADKRDTQPHLLHTYFHLYINVLVMAVVTMAAWVASTVFHVRDFAITEKIDYFLAGLTVLSGFHAVGQRVFRFYLPQKKRSLLLFTAGCVAAYSGHISKLLLDWLYTYNMVANVVVAVLQNLCWCILCYGLYTKYYNEGNQPLAGGAKNTHLKYVNPKRVILSSFYTRSPKLFSLYPLLLSTIVAFGMLLEIFDFPPFFFELVDAHALWHLVTIFPAAYGIYDWIIWDVEENVIPELLELEEAKNQ